MAALLACHTAEVANQYEAGLLEPAQELEKTRFISAKERGQGQIRRRQQIEQIV
jgi:hypothetical protein